MVSRVQVTTREAGVQTAPAIAVLEELLSLIIVLATAVGAVENPELLIVKTKVLSLMLPLASAVTVTSPIFPTPEMLRPLACVVGTVTVGREPTIVIVGAATDGVMTVVVPPEEARLQSLTERYGVERTPSTAPEGSSRSSQRSPEELQPSA